MRFFPFGYYYFFLLVFIFIPFHTLWFYTYTHAHTHKYTRSLGINTYIDTLTATQITHLYNVQYGCWWNLHKHTCTYNTYKRSLLYLSRMVSVQLVWKNNTVWTRAKNLSIVPYWKCYRNTPTKFDETKSQLLARTQFTNAFSAVIENDSRNRHLYAVPEWIFVRRKIRQREQYRVFASTTEDFTSVYLLIALQNVCV